MLCPSAIGCGAGATCPFAEGAATNASRRENYPQARSSHSALHSPRLHNEGVRDIS